MYILPVLPATNLVYWAFASVLGGVLQKATAMTAVAKAMIVRGLTSASPSGC